MLGVLLCGGESKRMGSDKALLVTTMSTWAELAYNTLSALNIPVVLSVNAKQKNYYNHIFPSKNLIVDDDDLHIGGPLHGLLTVHKIYTTSALLLLACDMPMMTPQVIENLIKEHQTNPTKEAIFFSNNQQPEPLCAIYSAQGLRKILALYNTNQLLKYSMKYMLEQLDTLPLTIPQHWLPYFKNYNSKTDLRDL